MDVTSGSATLLFDSTASACLVLQMPQQQLQGVGGPGRKTPAARFSARSHCRGAHCPRCRRSLSHRSKEGPSLVHSDSSCCYCTLRVHGIASPRHSRSSEQRHSHTGSVCRSSQYHIWCLHSPSLGPGHRSLAGNLHPSTWCL